MGIRTKTPAPRRRSRCAPRWSMMIICSALEPVWDAGNGQVIMFVRVLLEHVIIL